MQTPRRRYTFVTSAVLGIDISAGSLGTALANEKTPLRDAAAPTPKRAQKPPDRSTVARRRVVIGVVAAVAVLGVLWFLFGRGDASPIDIGQIINPTPAPPQFVFETVDSKPEAAAPHIDKGKLTKAAERNAPAVQDALQRLLQAGYIDPGSWGDAGALDDYFTEDAAGSVEPEIDTLSLGKDAADTIESVTPLPSRLKVTTLLDGDLNPIRALGEVRFKAKATNTDASTIRIEVTGAFFLVPDGDTWKVEAFDLDRQMKPHKAKPSATSPTASEGA